MNSVILTAPPLLGLLAAAAVLAVLCQRRPRGGILCALGCGLATVALLLWGLVLGAGLEELTAALLLLTAATLLAGPRGGDGT